MAVATVLSPIVARALVARYPETASCRPLSEAGSFTARPRRISDRGRHKPNGCRPEEISGHSLRFGFCTTAAANGANERQIANQTGHRSMEVLRGYIRHGTVFTDNAATRLGL